MDLERIYFEEPCQATCCENLANYEIEGLIRNLFLCEDYQAYNYSDHLYEYIKIIKWIPIEEFEEMFEHTCKDKN